MGELLVGLRMFSSPLFQNDRLDLRLCISKPWLLQALEDSPLTQVTSLAAGPTSGESRKSTC